MRVRLLATSREIQSVLWPEVAFNGETRRVFEHEAREGNARILRWLLCAVAPAHVLAAVFFFGRTDVDPARAAWVAWMVRFNVILGTVGALAAAVAWRGRPAWAWRALGDTAGSLYLVVCAGVAASAQRVHPNMNLFCLTALSTAFFLRLRPRVYLCALLVAAGTVLAGVLSLQPDELGRRADVVALSAVCSMAMLGFFISRATRARELKARRAVEQLNTELERRVSAQVGEIVRRAYQIDGLNTQLSERIRERSRELSMALARLAEGHQALAPGVVLGGRVEIQAWIGQGGMGAVYRGHDRVTDRAVAVKVVQASSASELDGLYRFLREVQAMATLAHPAIVRPIHVDVSEDGRLFHVMELVEGEGLESCLARLGRLPPGAVARLGAVLADALGAAHESGVVHRDVKPGNVMLTREAPGLKLLDFGISKVWDPVSKESQGRLLGTPEFLSPEQVNAPQKVAAPTDVYALGVVLYLCLSGHLPFDAESARTMIFTRVLGIPADIETWVPSLDPAFAAAVMSCLHKDPERRPSAPALADTLSALADAAGAPPLETLGLPSPPAREAPVAPGALSPTWT